MRLAWSQPMCTAIWTQVEGPKKKVKKEEHKKKQVVAPPTAPPAQNLVFCLPLQSHFILAVIPPVTLNMLGIKKVLKSLMTNPLITSLSYSTFQKQAARGSIRLPNVLRHQEVTCSRPPKQVTANVSSCSLATTPGIHITRGFPRL